MKITEALIRLRKNNKLSQEKFAELLEVSRQAVQKWESGISKPGIEHIIRTSNVFNVSLDILLHGSDGRAEETAKQTVSILPDFNSYGGGIQYPEELMTEFTQSMEEGKDIAQYEELFLAVSKMPKGTVKAQLADGIFQLVLNAPLREDYKYNEPSGLESIKALRGDFIYKRKKVRDDLREKISGAWTGRICGCLLGKPVESIRTDELNILLKKSSNYPMHRYIMSCDVTEEMYDTFRFNLRGRYFADTISYAPADDDINYTVMAATLIDKYGRNFVPYNVLQLWCDSQPKSAYWTAERVAFCNFISGYCPPNTAIYKNPYREWIGAQIRGDYFGYINPGDPEEAAEMAWRDASVSHVKNGIYGEMFAAAMIAYAAVCSYICEIIKAGLAQIPVSSRLYEAVNNIIDEYNNGINAENCFKRIHECYDENRGHDWCHTIPNAMIVTASLLYGENNFEKSICMSVQAGFDTDCNGATVDSVLGMKNGIKSIGKEWIEPVNGLADTTLCDAANYKSVGRVSISDMVEKTLEHIKQK